MRISLKSMMLMILVGAFCFSLMGCGALFSGLKKSPSAQKQVQFSPEETIANLQAQIKELAEQLEKEKARGRTKIKVGKSGRKEKIPFIVLSEIDEREYPVAYSILELFNNELDWVEPYYNKQTGSQWVRWYKDSTVITFSGDGELERIESFNPSLLKNIRAKLKELKEGTEEKKK